MSEMIERVARAIAESGGSNWDACKKAPGQMMLKMYVGMARAAIGAMREPTEVMTNEWPHAHAHLIEGHWRRAIDAVLSEKPEDVA